MATIKSYTDLNQSIELANILPLESADMFYIYIYTRNREIIRINDNIEDYNNWNTYPAWSLAALLNAVNFSTINLHYDKARKDWVISATIHDNTKHCTKYESTRALNPVDACYEMILKLHELKKL